MAPRELARLEALIERHMGKPVGDGEHCGSGIARIIRKLHGVDCEALFRAEFWDGRPKRPVSEIAVCICERLGWPEIDPAMAEPGDIGVRHRTLGVKARAWVWKSPAGMLIGGRAERAWRIA